MWAVGRATWVAVLAGGALGAVAAVASMPKAENPGALPATAAPRAELPSSVRERPSASRAEPTLAAAVADTEAHAAPVASGSASARPAASSSASASASPGAIVVTPGPALSAPPSGPRVSPASTVTPPQTPKEFERAQIRCDQGDVDACEREALAYETGSLVAQDPVQAKKFRTIRFTLLVTQCDNSASLEACAELARMFRDGDGVEKKPHTAELLFKRARDLCKFRDAAVCATLD